MALLPLIPLFGALAFAFCRSKSSRQKLLQSTYDTYNVGLLGLVFTISVMFFIGLAVIAVADLGGNPVCPVGKVAGDGPTGKLGACSFLQLTCVELQPDEPCPTESELLAMNSTTTGA